MSREDRRIAFADLLQRPYLGRLAVLVPVWFLWYIGNYGFLGDGTTLFADHGHKLANSILFLGIGAIGYPIGAGSMALIADRVECRLLIFVSTLV